MILPYARFVATLVGAVALFLLCLGPQASSQEQPSLFKAMRGYEEAPFIATDSTIDTGRGPKHLRVSLKKLRIEGRGHEAKIDLPARGLAMIQHQAGEVELTINGRKFEPIEGEWLTLDLPISLTARSLGDAVLLDLVLVEE